MSVKGDWSRVKDQAAYGATMDEIQANEKKRRERLAAALEVTGGKLKKTRRQ